MEGLGDKEGNKQEGTLWGGWEYIQGYINLPELTELYSKILYFIAGKLQFDTYFLCRKERNRTAAIKE